MRHSKLFKTLHNKIEQIHIIVITNLIMLDYDKSLVAEGAYSMVILLYAWWAIFAAAFYDAFH